MNEVFTTGAEGVQMLAEFPGNWGALISAEIKVGKLARICTMPHAREVRHLSSREAFSISLKRSINIGNAKLLMLGLVRKNYLYVRIYRDMALLRRPCRSNAFFYRYYWILWLPWERPLTVAKSNKLQNQIRLHHQNMTFGIGKTVTESNMSQNQTVTKSNDACNRNY